MTSKIPLKLSIPHRRLLNGKRLSFYRSISLQLRKNLLKPLIELKSAVIHHKKPKISLQKSQETIISKYRKLVDQSNQKRSTEFQLTKTLSSSLNDDRCHHPPAKAKQTSRTSTFIFKITTNYYNIIKTIFIFKVNGTLQKFFTVGPVGGL